MLTLLSAFAVDDISAYHYIILFALIVILSYVFNLIAKKTNIPAVLLLMGLGILMKLGMDQFGLSETADGQPRFDFLSTLEVLGIVGLIMIVLEAALDLELSKEKVPIIGKSLSVALLGLLGSTAAAAAVLHYLSGIELLQSIVYAIPLSVMSSAIICPSVTELETEKKEFMIFESTFSDVLGIMLFYFMLSFAESGEMSGAAAEFGISLFLTLLVSVVASIVLIIFFQNIKAHVKLFLLISILLMLYAIGKLAHLSPLLIILIFGLILKNHRSVFRGPLSNWVNRFKLDQVGKEFYTITIETAFLVRTFFFVIFGITVVLSSLLSLQVLYVSGLIVLSIYVVRVIMLFIFSGKNILPQLFIAPRGLITILLFFAIPDSLKLPAESFDPGILLFVILATSLIMTFALIKNKLTPGDTLAGNHNPIEPAK